MSKQERREKLRQSLDEKYRNEHERRIETLQIIYQLKQNNLTHEFSAIRSLLEVMQEYVMKGDRKEIHIPFPEQKKVIKGVLALHKGEDCTVFLKHIE